MMLGLTTLPPRATGMLGGARSPSRPGWALAPPQGQGSAGGDSCLPLLSHLLSRPWAGGCPAAPPGTHQAPSQVMERPGPSTLYGDESLADLCLPQCSVSNFMGCISRVIESRCPQNATAAHRNPQGTGLLVRTRVRCSVFISKPWPRQERKASHPPAAWGSAGTPGRL